MKLQGLSPGGRLLVAMLAGLGVMIAMVWWAQARPWLGLDLQWDAAAGGARVMQSQGPGAAIAPGTLLTEVSGGERQMRLAAIDFTIEPDGNLATYAEYRDFRRRQGELAAIQDAAELRLTDASGHEHVLRPATARPLSELPRAFWVQLFVAFFAWLIVFAVWVFRPGDISARYLLANGLAITASASGAAVYTTREFAVPFEQLMVLKTLNFGGGLAFFATLLALLWHYPRRLGPTWVSIGFVLAYLAWYLAQELGAVESMMVGRRWPVFAAVPGVLLLGLLQWFGTRRDPVGRAALQWFLLSWMVGTSLFIVIVFVPQIYGVNTAAAQAYSFLLILLIYGGLAFGITRFRLFELGEWWFRTLTWVLGALMLVALDLLLLLGLHLSFTLSLTLALVVSGFLWLPLRGWLWLRLMKRGRISERDLFRSVLHVALGPTPELRQQRWEVLLHDSFAPLRLEPAAAGVAAAIHDNGLALQLPGVAGLASMRLEYPDEGRRLFSPRDLALGQQLVEMIAHAGASRDAYNQGVRDERERIARDLHDDLGSQLLTALHQPCIEPARASIGRAIATMRGILDQLSGRELQLGLVIAELRHETRQQLEGSGIQLHWPVDEDPDGDPELDPGTYRHYLSVMRELIANIVRHAGAGRLSVQIGVEQGRLVTLLEDDGRGFDGQGDNGGYGLGNLRQRVAELGGRLDYQPRERGTLTRLSIPLRAAGEGATAASAHLRGEGDIG